MRRIPVARLIRESFEKWLSWPEYDIVDIVGATIVANRLEGEPLWLAIVGPSSSGKTELVRALDGLDRIHFLDRITPATFVSGYREAGVKVKGNGNAAARLGLKSSTLRSRIKKLGIARS